MKEEGLNLKSHMWELLFRSHSDVRAAVALLSTQPSVTATGANVQCRFSSDAPSTFGQNEDLIVLPICLLPWRQMPATF